MSNFKKEMEARNQGMAYALKLAKSGGIEALEKEIKDRGLSGISLSCSQKQIEEAGEQFKIHAIKFSMVVALVTLYEDFKFSNFQARLFNKKYMKRVADLAQAKILITDYIEQVKNVYGIEIELDD